MLFASKYKKKEEKPKIPTNLDISYGLNEDDISGIGSNNVTGMQMLTEENRDQRLTLGQNVHIVPQTPTLTHLPGLDRDQSTYTLATGIDENLTVLGAKIDDGGTGGAAKDDSSIAGCCRICLSEEEEDNPLICPCKCAGSMGQIHVECLRSWLNSKR